MTKNIFIGGAHRGGKAITERVLRTIPIREFEEVVIADPKEDRAVRLAQIWNQAGVPAVGIPKNCEDVIQESAADMALLSIDTVKPMREILENTSFPTQWQLLARGLGADGPIVGIAGTIPPNENSLRDDAKRLIGSLSTFISRQSSENIRNNPLNADFLYSMRKKVSAHSVKRLTMLLREPKDVDGGNLNLFWGTEQFPMVVKDKDLKNNFRETKRQALEIELPSELQLHKSFAIALIAERAVDFFVIDSTRRHRSVRFFMPLIHSLPTGSSEKAMAAIGAGILLTLGLGLFAGTALAATPAMVTD